MARVAFFTYGIMPAAYGAPQVQGFVDRTPATYEQVDASPGFVGRLSQRHLPPAEQVYPRFTDPYVPRTEAHTRVAHTLSLWQDLQSVYALAYGGLHREALRLRSEWFEHPQWPTYAAWWVGDDEEPTYAEAARRLEHLHDHGPTPFAFHFRAAFDANGQPSVVVARERAMEPSPASW